MTTKLAQTDIQTHLQTLTTWQLKDGQLHKTYTFQNFTEAFGFMTRAALVIEKMNHHPEWSNSYKQVTVNLTTHDVGGISDLDIELAKKLDELI